MPSRVILVHDSPDLLNTLSAALTWAGHAVAQFTEPRMALSTIETASFELLITRVEFRRQTISGVDLANIARDKHPGLPVLFLGPQESGVFTEGSGSLWRHRQAFGMFSKRQGFSSGVTVREAPVNLTVATIPAVVSFAPHDMLFQIGYGIGPAYRWTRVLGGCWYLARVA